MALNFWPYIASRIPRPSPAETEFMASALESSRANQDLQFLRKQVKPWLGLVAHNGGQLGQVFGLVGYQQGLLERGAYAGRFFRRLQVRLSVRVSLWELRRQFPARPGWNDYYMTLWFVTGKDEYLRELYRRGTDRPFPGAIADLQNTYATARWMIFSVRSRLPDFDQALTVLENERGEKITLPAFHDFAPGFVPTIEPERGGGVVPPARPS
jgi:hypothetical protein